MQFFTDIEKKPKFLMEKQLSFQASLFFDSEIFYLSP